MCNRNLSRSQERFNQLLVERAPFLLHLWDIHERAYRPDVVDEFLATASHGEAIVARFFLGVWRNENEFEFDPIEAASVLSSDHMEIITDWLKKPFWP